MAAAVRSRAEPLSSWMTAGSGAGMVLATLLPVITIRAAPVGTVTKLGIASNDGRITLGLGLCVVGAAIGAMRSGPSRKAAVAVVVMGAFTLVLAVVNLLDVNRVMVDLNQIDPGVRVDGGAGAGLYLTALSGALAAVGGILLYQSASKQPWNVAGAGGPATSVIEAAGYSRRDIAPAPAPAAPVPAQTARSGGAWLADPSRRHELRYWDGGAWTVHVSDKGVHTTDPL